MAKGQPTSAPAKVKKERTVLTPEQRLAKKKAELEELERKVAERSNKARDTAWEKRAKLIERRNDLDSQIEAIEKEFGTPDNHSAEDEAASADEDTES